MKVGILKVFLDIVSTTVTLLEIWNDAYQLVVTLVNDSLDAVYGEVELECSEYIG